MLTEWWNLDRCDAEDWIRSRAKAVPLGDGRIVARCYGTRSLYLLARDESITPHLALDGYWEIWVSMYVRRMSGVGLRCVDVGANIGVFTALMAEAGGQVTAFEPCREVFDVLAANARLNGFPGVWSIQKAAGREAGTAMLHVERNNFCNSTCRPSEAGAGTEAVELVGLDHWFLAPVHLVKIDAEGMDYEVLQGANRLLAASPQCTVIFEHSPTFAGHCGSGDHAHPVPDAEAVLNEFAAMGYHLGFVDTDGKGKRCRFSEVPTDRTSNLILSRGRVEAFA